MDLALKKLGMHRVISPDFCLPQAAEVLKVSLPIDETELLIDVNALNIDSASFHQLYNQSERDLNKLSATIKSIVYSRGKMHNPVTQSGGMLIGRVLEKGSHHSSSFKVGDLIATLVSLTLTPLVIEEILEINPSCEQVRIKGKAILFESGIAALIPDQIDQKICLSLLDVCGAPALVLREAKEQDKVLFVGAGKAAVLSAAALREKFKNNIQISFSDISEKALEEVSSFAHFTYPANAQHPVEFAKRVGLENYDLVVNVTNVENTEMASLLSVKQKGKVIFFGMSTQFQKVALGAEGIAKDATLIIGNGYVQGHAELAVTLYQQSLALQHWMQRRIR